MFAHVVNGKIRRVGSMPPSARRLDSNDWVLGLGSASAKTLAACGWFDVVESVKPDDTDTHTFDRSVEMVGGVPTVVWVERPWTTAELSAIADRANRSAIDDAITAAIDELDRITSADPVPAVPSGTLTTAQLSGVVRAMRGSVQQNREGVQRVARTLKHTVRMVRGDFDGVD